MKVIEERTIYSGKIFDLKVHKLEIASGKVIRREFVDHPGAVAIIAIDREKYSWSSSTGIQPEDGWLKCQLAPLRMAKIRNIALKENWKRKQVTELRALRRSSALTSLLDTVASSFISF